MKKNEAISESPAISRRVERGEFNAAGIESVALVEDIADFDLSQVEITVEWGGVKWLVRHPLRVIVPGNQRDRDRVLSALIQAAGAMVGLRLESRVPSTSDQPCLADKDPLTI